MLHPHRGMLHILRGMLHPHRGTLHLLRGMLHPHRGMLHLLSRGVARLDLMVGQNTSLVTYVLLTMQHAGSYVRLLRVVV